VTDTEGGIAYDPINKPAVANLLDIYHHMTGAHMNDIEAQFAGKGYGDFKKGLADAIIAHLEPISKKIAAYKEDPTELMRILDQGRDAARAMASKTLADVKKNVGLGR
jgi:tryptophanyl-tRNA synthetase